MPSFALSIDHSPLAILGVAFKWQADLCELLTSDSTQQRGGGDHGHSLGSTQPFFHLLQPPFEITIFSVVIDSL